MNNDFQTFVSVLGLIGVSGFAFFLAALIFDTRRDSKADKWLATVLFVWGLIGVAGIVRIGGNFVILPYLNPALWIASLIVEVFATVFVLKERGLIRVRTTALVERQEEAVHRQEIVTDRLEVNLKEDRKEYDRRQ